MNILDVLKKKISALPHQNSEEPQIFSPSPLTSTERFFLQKIDGQNIENPYVAGYWEYEYNIDFATIMKKLLDNGYLKTTIDFEVLPRYTVPLLKQILERLNLPVSGKKSVLVERIMQNTTEQELIDLTSNFPKRYFLTELGKNAVKDLKESMTKDLEFEDACLELIYQQDFKGAYKLVCKNEAKKKGQIRKDYVDNNPAETKLKYYAILYNADMTCLLPIEAQRFETQIKAGMILGHMTCRDPMKLIYRLIGEHEYNERLALIIKSLGAYATTSANINSLLYLCNYDLNREYQISCTLDNVTCERCGVMDLRHFKFRDAKVGVNCPPFHFGCRCCVTSYLPDCSPGERAARDKNGRSIYVPDDMTWQEWKKRYN